MLKDEEEEMYKSGMLMDRSVMSRTADHKLMDSDLFLVQGSMDLDLDLYVEPHKD